MVKLAKTDGVPMLEKDIFSKLENGNPKDKEQVIDILIRRNSELVSKICHSFRNRGLPYEDLYCEGNIGLLRAIDKFNINRGVKFSTYATFWIKHAIRRALANHSKTIRIPCRTADNIKRLKSLQMKMKQELGRFPSRKEIATRMGLSEKVVRRLSFAYVSTFSFNAPVSSENKSEVLDTFQDYIDNSPEQILINKEGFARLKKYLEKLTDRENDILTMRFGFDQTNPKTLDYISRKVGLSRERVRQILSETLQKLRHLMKAEEDEMRMLLAC